MRTQDKNRVANEFAAIWNKYPNLTVAEARFIALDRVLDKRDSTEYFKIMKEEGYGIRKLLTTNESIIKKGYADV